MLKVGMRAVTAGISGADVTTTEVTFLRTDQTLCEAWQILHDQSITGAPVLGARDRRAIVVTDNGAIAGIVTPIDVLRALVRGDDVARQAGDGPVTFVDLSELA